MKKSELKELYQMMFPEYPDIVTVRQLREMLGISRQLAYDLINDGELQAIKIGNRQQSLSRASQSMMLSSSQTRRLWRLLTDFRLSRFTALFIFLDLPSLFHNMLIGIGNGIFEKIIPLGV